MIKIKTYSINQQIILTNEVLNLYLNKFWEDVFQPINLNEEVKHLMVICKVKYTGIEEEEGSYRTLGPLRRVEFKDLNSFNEYLSGRLGIIVESYESNLITEIAFTYIIKDGIVSDKDRLLLEDLSEKDISFHEFNRIKLPVSMDPSDYGSIRGKTKIEEGIRYFVRKGNRVYEIDVSLDKLINKVSIVGASDLKWTDTQINDDLIKREIGKATI